MYRGRPPPRGGGYPPPPRPNPTSSCRDDRNRLRPPCHPDYHDQVPRDSYRRSPPRRRYPSPGSGSYRGGEKWAGGPPRERSPSPRRPAPLDHNLVVTVGNELRGPSGSSRLHNRDYPHRPEYDRSRSGDQSPDRSRAKSRGRSKSRARSKSRPRSQSRSPDRSRARSRGRSRSHSPDRSRAKSRGRSRSHSPDRSRAKSRGRSKSRPRSKSRSRSRGRSYSKAVSHGRSKSRQWSRSRSRSTSSSSSSSSISDDNDEKSRKEFKELETARRRKELEEMLSLPTKSILKRRNDSDDSPSLRSSDSPRALEGSKMSQVAEQLLLAVKGMEPHRVASILSELQSDPRMAQSACLNAEVREILNLLGEQAVGAKAQEKMSDDIDDEEKFLYGDSEEPKPPPASESVRHHGLDMYGEVSEEMLYGDYHPQKAVIAQTYGLPPGVSPHLQAPPTKEEVDMRYASRPTITADQNIRVQVSNPAYPPGTEPLGESERQALEEYEKIQDLLKTIGLDLGVTEISKMAARTKERLHGNRPPPKTPTRRTRYSSGSSDGSRRSHRRRSHSGSSSSRSRSRSRGRGHSWSSDDSRRKSSAPPKSHKGRDVKEMKTEWSNAAPSPQTPLDPNTLPPRAGIPIPTYPPPQVHGMIPPNFPPPGYGQYGNYLPYMHQQWPPMYPPPNMTMPPQIGPDEPPPTLQVNKAAPEPEAKGLMNSGVEDGEKGNVSSLDRRVSEEENNESQKQKVLEEREKLKEERETRMKKKECLMKELERLRKHQGELLRKKRREKGGHKDPLLQEISHLQEAVMIQISNLRKEHEAAEKKRNEIDKVALILGLSPSDRPRRTSKPAAEQEDPPPPEKEKEEPERSPKQGQAASSSMMKLTSAVQPPSRPFPDKPPVSAPTPPMAPPPDPFEYYDAGNHWCKNCNVTSGSMFDFFTHLHSKTHRKTLDPYERPWASSPSKMIKNTGSEEKLAKPAKGSEFLLPVRGFFCLLCREFYGDGICAEEHVTTHAHNEKYKKQMHENPLYEQRRNLDRQAGLAADTSGKKRKREDDEKRNKDKEEKYKHKKEKKDKERQKEEDDADEDFKDPKILEEERPSYSKKDEDEKYKYSKKDDKYRYSREEEERDKYSRRDEEAKYTHSKEEYQLRYRKGEDNRYDDHPKYEPREDEPKYKYGKQSDFRSKHDKDRDEGKHKTDKESFKKLEPGKPEGKPEFSKPQPPPKPHDPPKILCGPSPAMRAKLRKQNLEASRPAPPTTNPAFGKFTWKKKENVLAKEAQKVAAEFIKDDEASAKQNPVSVEESFAKSVAVAKEIAEKLGGQQNVPPPWLSNAANRGRIRPNLPGPAAVLRKTAMMGKPATLNTFLSIRPPNPNLLGPPPKDGPIFPYPATPNTIQSIRPPNLNLLRPPPTDGPRFPNPAPLNTFHSIRPQNTSQLGPPPKDGPIFPDPATPNTVQSIRPPNPNLLGLPPKGGSKFSGPQTKAQNTLLKAKSEPPVGKTGTSMPAPAVDIVEPVYTKPVPPGSKSAPFEAQSAEPVSNPVQLDTNPVALVSKPAPVEVKPVEPVFKPAPSMVNPTPTVSKPVRFEVNPAPPVSKPTPNEVKPVVPPAKPSQPTMIKIVSDVAAPGVPECEQTRTVFVKPPPFMTLDSGAQKSEKLKTNLAAAKAQDLFDIFYSSVGQSGTSSITKPATDDRAINSCISKNKLPTPQPQKLQPLHQPPTQLQPPTAVCTSPQSNSPSLETQPESNIQIESIWSLQSISDPPPETPSSETTSQTQPNLNPPVQSEVQSLPEKQPLTSKPGQITSQTEPPELNPTPKTQFQSKLTPQNQTKSPSEPQPDQSTQPLSHLSSQFEGQRVPQNQSSTPKSASQTCSQTEQPEHHPNQDTQLPSNPENHPDTAPEPKLKSIPKTRSKTTKRTPPTPCPVRQTRSQTRYQTRQQQSQSEPEPNSGDSDTAGSDPKGLDTSDPGSGLKPDEGAPYQGDPSRMEITSGTLSLPSDFTSLDFETDFNFE